jgi:hexosaminidase
MHPNTIGALRGLQTLIQLADKDDSGYYFPCVAIDDSPRFQWRGLMIDAARHFISFEEMKKNIDAMAAVKMNVLHWHLTDDEGFRIESKNFPLLHQKGSNNDYYSQAQLKELVSYAKDRGIIIVPEFDMPGHSQSWFAGYPEMASLPGPYRPGPRMQWQTEHPNPNAPKSTSIADIIANTVAPTFDPTNEKNLRFSGQVCWRDVGHLPVRLHAHRS